MAPRFRQHIIAASLLVCVLIAGTGLVVLTDTKTVHAQSVGENIIGDFSGCLAGALADLIIGSILSYFSTTVPTSPIPEVIKEGIKDCLAWAIANGIIEEITAQITEWTNSGFDGNPAYVTNIKRQIQDLINNEVGQFIEETEQLAFLCEPFQREVLTQIAITFDQEGSQAYRNRAACTLDDVIDNAEDFQAFVDGDFRRGGWTAWFEFTQKPQNNPIGAYFLAQQELSNRIQEEEEEETEQIEQGRGFLTKQACFETRECVLYGGSSNPLLPPPCLEYETLVLEDGVPLSELEENLECTVVKNVTPGSVIQETLQKTLGLGVERIVQIDELNEALSTLFAGLFNEILSDDEGLYGAGEFIEESTGFAGIEFGNEALTALLCHQSPQNPGTGDINISAPGPFSYDTSSSIGVNVNGHYVTGTFDFDFYLDEIPPPQPPETGGEPWRSYFVLRTIGSPNAFWFGGLVTSDGDNIFHTGGFGENSPPGVQNWFRSNNQVFFPQNWYHVSIDYIAGGASVFTLSSGQGPGGNVVHQAVIQTENSIFQHSSGPKFIMGNSNAYIFGAVAEDVEIHLQPGAPVCGGSGGTTGTGSGGGTLQI